MTHLEFRHVLLLLVVTMLLFALCACNGEHTPGGEDKPEGCEHELVHHEAKAPTCTEIGWDAYDECSKCDYTTYAEKAATGHTEEKLGGKDASCTEDGLTDGVKCSVCDEVLTAQENIPATGHTESTVTGFAATCTENGLTDGVKCSVCGEVLTAQETIVAAGHKYDDKYDAECNVCGYIRDADCAHTSTEAIPGYAATCTASGLTDGEKCTKCGEITKNQSVITALGHNEVNHEAKAPTCTEIGWDTYVTCSRCDYTTYTEKAALGHNEVVYQGYAATCTEDGLTDGVKCSVCNEVLTAQETMPALGHKDANDDGTCEICKAYMRLDYTINVSSVGGLKLRGVMLNVYEAEDTEGLVSLGFGKTDINGQFSLELSIMKSYRIVINSAPDGYKFVDSYTFDSDRTANIELESAPIEEGFSDIPDDFYYEVGDVIHDFSITDLNGNTVSVSEVLGEQDLLVLNFWYVECYYCLWEFPFISDAYSAFNANGQKVEIFAINDAGNTPKQVREFVSAPRDIDGNVYETPEFPFFLASESGYENLSIISKFFEYKSGIGYPTSVFVDRYGVICCIEIGAVPDSDEWTAAFEHFTAKDYKQVFLDSISELA